MKKLHILIPSLVATVGMPLVSMVSCNKSEVVPTNITISQTEATIKAGESVQLTVTIEPEGATGKITWTSSDDTIAVVGSNGKVTGIKNGTVTITAKLDGYDLQATCTITVTSPEPVSESIIIEGLAGSKFEADYYDGGQTSQFTTYLIRGDEKIDISGQATFHFNLGEQLTYDATNKCIKWSKELVPGVHNVEVIVEDWGVISEIVSFEIYIKGSSRQIRAEGFPGGTQGIPVTPGVSGYRDITIWYDFPNNKDSVNITKIVEVEIWKEIPGVSWNSSAGRVEWDGNMDFDEGDEIAQTFAVTFGSVEWDTVLRFIKVS